MLRNLVLLCLCLGIGLGSLAQPQRRPPCQPAEFRALDFWLGEWDVVSKGVVVGQSRVTREAHGCLLVEEWFGINGDRGIGFHYYQPVEKQWRHHFVGGAWNVDYVGQPAQAGIRFEGTGIKPDGSRPRWRLQIQPSDDGNVRQWREESADGSQWQPSYDFTYRKRSEPISAAANAKPLCQDDVHRRFAFWLGEWNVTAGGKPAGRNAIRPRANGCVLYENWTGSQGGEGKSLNFVDVVTGRWRQVWVSPGARLDLSGEWRDGAIRYEGKSRYPGSDGDTLERLSFTPAEDGTVRQFWQQSADGGATWTTAFDGLYRKAN